MGEASMQDGTYQPIYLDGHSTTPLAPEAAAAMAPWWCDFAANAHSPHLRGMRAAAAVERARSAVGRLLGVDAQEVVFTSGATEANNIAIIGTALAALESGDPRREIIVSQIEHKSVLEAANSLKSKGFKVCLAPVDASGRVDVNAFRNFISSATLLVSIMGANNEIGTVQPLDELLPLVRSFDAIFHVDAAQLAGRLPFDAAPFDLVSISSHKLYGPMGVGALVVSAAAAIRPLPLFHGGGQESGLRPGTLPTPLIVGFGEAADLAFINLETDRSHVSALASRLLEGFRSHDVKFERTTPPENTLPGSISIRFSGIDASELIGELSNRVCISEGSACSSGQIQTSHVLKSLNISAAAANETVRICCGRYNTLAEIDISVAEIVRSTMRLALANWSGYPVGNEHEGHFF